MIRDRPFSLALVGLLCVAWTGPAGAADPDELESPLRVPLPRSSAPVAPSLPDVRADLPQLQIDLGPVTKEVLVGEGADGAALARIAAVPHTTVGFAPSGGNTLTDRDLRRLGRLARVHVYLQAPVLGVHLELIRRLPARRELTVRVPAGEAPAAAWVARLPLAGPGRVHVLLEGPTAPERIAPLSNLRHGSVAVRLPEAGLDPALKEALAALRADLEIVVPAKAPPESLASLEGLRVAVLTIETEGNRIAPGLVEALRGRARRLRVELDERLTHEDLVQLRGLPGLELRVRAPPGRTVPPRLTDLLRASEGDRGR